MLALSVVGHGDGEVGAALAAGSVPVSVRTLPRAHLAWGLLLVGTPCVWFYIVIYID